MVDWFSIRLFLVITILQGWEAWQIDFVLESTLRPMSDVTSTWKHTGLQHEWREGEVLIEAAQDHLWNQTSRVSLEAAFPQWSDKIRLRAEQD
jgi:hypothetical protein